MQIEAGCHLYQACGHLSRGRGHAEASHYLFGVYGPLTDFRKIHIMNQSWLLVWKTAGSGSRWMCKLGWAGIHQGWMNGVS